MSRVSAAEAARRLSAADPVHAVCCHRMSDGSGALGQRVVGVQAVDQMLSGASVNPTQPLTPAIIQLMHQ